MTLTRNTHGLASSRAFTLVGHDGVVAAASIVQTRQVSTSAPPHSNIAGTGGGTVVIQQRSSFTQAHLLAAGFLRDRAKELEAQGGGGEGLWFERHRAAVIGSIVSSFAFVEANINQLYADAKDGPADTPARALGTAYAQALADAWSTKKIQVGSKSRTAEWHSTAVKYQIALDVVGKDKFDESASPFVEMDLVRQTRNALVHAHTETVVAYSTDPDVQETRTSWQVALECRKTAGDFSYAPHKSEQNAFFPDRLLSASFAEWCLRGCVDFADEFYKRLGPRPPYQGIRGLL